ncbi:MAG: hypothetical protein KDD56_09435, partial [Bdellovibrionales bacterium]|nr:hypothetical protein [Bdellovibrionales bacterium]
SINSLQEICKLAAEVKRKRSNQREEAAISILLKEIISQVDQIASLKKSGFPASISLKNLSEMCGVLQSLDSDVQEKYLEKAIIAFAEAKLPTEVSNGNYRGPSQRIMKKKAEKAIEQLKKAFAA